MPSTRADIEMGVFEHFDNADRAVVLLVKMGVPTGRISVVCSEDLPELSADVEKVEGAASERRVEGIVRGGAIGTLLGGLTAATGLVATGGAALVIIGPLIGGAAAGIAGGFLGAMASRGLEPDAADFYDHALGGGAVLVAVEPPEGEGEPPQEEVRAVLRNQGARTHTTPAS